MIWDLPGIEIYRDIAISYCRGARAAIIVYDITQQDSLRDTRKWLDILRSASYANILKVLAGSKADLVSGREVTYEVICVCRYRFMSDIESAILLSNQILSHRRDTIS